MSNVVLLDTYRKHKVIRTLPPVLSLEAVYKKVYDNDVDFIGTYDEVREREGKWLFMINKKSGKIHMESLMKDDSWLWCGKLIWPDYDEYAFFKGQDPDDFLTCQRCQILWYHASRP